ncbi:hypothetical protein LJC60_10150, partial [Ruminococcaceae bacterium OttesenSCG-928-D13]|nr:hypothetical protein [Ruminococcaceae bacterium OttesenSCG-928-D13]
PKVVSEILGHADVKTTLQIYSHVFDSTAHEQAAKLDGLFTGLAHEPEQTPAPANAHYPNFKGMNKKAQNAASRTAKGTKGAKKKRGHAR